MTTNVSKCETTLTGLPGALLVAVSGGVDSMALLHALVASGRKPVVLHFDHGWRTESADEAKWVRAKSAKLGLRFFTARARPIVKDRREAEARAARYAFFSRIARRLAVPDLVLAHHADDQVETFLLQLLRGSGAGGCGMETVTQRNGLVLHRPWLGIWKKEIAAYALSHKLAWREDRSNADPRHRRNLIRHQVLPYLRKKLGVATGPNLWRAAEIARAESNWLDELCSDLAAQVELSVKALRAVALGRQRRTILRWLQRRGVTDISFADVEAIRGLLDQRDPARINLSAGKFARRRAGMLFVE